jgi:hypothetical protein
MKSVFALTTAIAMLVFAVDAQAGCGTCGPKDAGAAACAAGGCSAASCAVGGCSEASCAAGGCSAAASALASSSAAACDAGKGCPIAAAMERLPRLSFAVGEKKTCCSKEAAKLAKESGGHVHFCVAGKEFDSKSDAQLALIEATEKYVAAFAKPHSCPKSGKLTLAGQAQSCPKSAARTAERMQKAMGKVKLTYLVGEEACGCPVKAGNLAKESGQEKLFVVGAEKTACEKTARLNLARAKYKAAVTALVEAQAAAEAESTSGT